MLCAAVTYNVDMDFECTSNKHVMILGVIEVIGSFHKVHKILVMGAFIIYLINI